MARTIQPSKATFLIIWYLLTEFEFAKGLMSDYVNGMLPDCSLPGVHYGAGMGAVAGGMTGAAAISGTGLGGASLAACPTFAISSLTGSLGGPFLPIGGLLAGALFGGIAGGSAGGWIQCRRWQGEEAKKALEFYLRHHPDHAVAAGGTSYQRPPTSSLGYLAPSSSGHYRHPMMMQQPVVSSYLPMDPSMEEQLQEDYFSVGGFATENHHQLQHLHPPSASLQLTPSQEGTVLMLTGDNDIEEEEEEEKEIFKEIMMTLIKTVKEEEKEDGQEGGLEMEDEENKVKNLKAPWKSTKPVRAITFLDENGGGFPPLSSHQKHPSPFQQPVVVPIGAYGQKVPQNVLYSNQQHAPDQYNRHRDSRRSPGKFLLQRRILQNESKLLRKLLGNNWRETDK